MGKGKDKDKGTGRGAAGGGVPFKGVVARVDGVTTAG